MQPTGNAMAGKRMRAVGMCLAEHFPCFLHIDVLVFGSFFREGTFQQSKQPGIVYDFTEFLIGVVLGVLLCVKEALDLLFV